MEPEPAMPSRRRPWVRPVAIGVVALAGALWWWWPALTRDPDRTDVMVIGVGEIEQADQPIQRRIREEGMSVETVHVDPCTEDVATLEAVEDAAPAVVVLAPADVAACEDVTALVDAVASAAGAEPTVLLAAQTGQVDALRQAADDATVVDPTRLLGAADVTRMGCMWWDDCEPDGQVAVRDAAGGLTPAGGERVARVIVGSIP